MIYIIYNYIFMKKTHTHTQKCVTISKCQFVQKRKLSSDIAIVRLSTAHKPGYLQTLDTDYGFKCTISQPTPNAALA